MCENSSFLEAIFHFAKCSPGMAGDNIGLMLRGIDRSEVDRGMVIANPGSITSHTKFEGEVYLLTREEGGRLNPVFTGYRPQFFFWTLDVTGMMTLPDGIDMVLPGDHLAVKVELIVPVALAIGTRFIIREGDLTVGCGVITRLLDA